MKVCRVVGDTEAYAKHQQRHVVEYKPRLFHRSVFTGKQQAAVGSTTVFMFLNIVTAPSIQTKISPMLQIIPAITILVNQQIQLVRLTCQKL